MATEKWQHNRRVIVFEGRLNKDGELRVLTHGHDLFVPEDFENPDKCVAERLGKMEAGFYDKFKNRVAAADFLMHHLGKVEQGVPPKEVEEE